MKRSLKFLRARSLRYPAAIITGATLFAVIMVMVMNFHEAAGSEDYLFCKLTGGILGSVIFTMMFFVGLLSSLVGNRIMRSAPFAKTLYTRGVPLYVSFLNLSVELLMLAAYAVFVLASGLDIANLSDMLILAAIYCFVMNILYGAALSTRFGFLVMYLTGLSFIILSALFPGSKEIFSNGFGITLVPALLIFAGANLLSYIAARIICTVTYYNAEFKPTVMALQNITGGK